MDWTWMKNPSAWAIGIGAGLAAAALGLFLKLGMLLSLLAGAGTLALAFGVVLLMAGKSLPANPTAWALGAGAGLLAGALGFVLKFHWTSLLIGAGTGLLVLGFTLLYLRKPEPSTPRTRSSNWVRASLAFIVVLGGGVLVWHMWHNPSFVFKDQPPLDPNIIITPVFSLIGGVTGYYFGAKGTDTAIDSAAKANATAKDTAATAREGVRTALTKLQKAKVGVRAVTKSAHDEAVSHLTELASRLDRLA
jgi:hypothetical protein